MVRINIVRPQIVSEAQWRAVHDALLAKGRAMMLAVAFSSLLLLANRAQAAGGTAAQSGLQVADPPASFRVHDLLPDFWKFWAAAEGQPLARQVQLWRDLYVRPHQAVFDDLAAPCKPEYDSAWAEAHYFPALPKIVPGMRAAAAGLAEKLSLARERFLRTFPDMRWTGDVYIMASGYCFDGRAQVIRGREAILFGIDGRVSLGEMDPIPAITHELFHRYHSRFFDFKASSGYPLWTALWAEGLAVSAAERISPAASETDLDLTPIGMTQQVDRRRKQLSADFLSVFNATDDEDAVKWFNDSNSKDPIVPARAGYELGVLVVRELAHRYSIQAMAHWSRSQAEPRIRAALMSISKVGGSN